LYSQAKKPFPSHQQSRVRLGFESETLTGGVVDVGAEIEKVFLVEGTFFEFDVTPFGNEFMWTYSLGYFTPLLFSDLRFLVSFQKLRRWTS